MGNRRKKYTEEQITQILKEAEVSNNVSDTLRKYGVNDSSYYRWKAKYGGMDSKSIQRLRELERENARLKRIVADQMLDITILWDINSKNTTAGVIGCCSTTCADSVKISTTRSF